MNEETKVMANEATNNTEVQGTYTESDTSSNGGGSKGLGVLVVGALIAGGVGLFKNRDKIKAKKEEKQIKKLEKKGYVVYKAEEVCEEAEDLLPEDFSEEAESAEE